MKRVSACAVVWIYATQLVASCSPSAPINDTRQLMATRRQHIGDASPPVVDSDTVLQTQTSSSKAAGSTMPGAWVTSVGTARYTFPLWTSPGRLGIEPRLALNYSSDSGNGLIGMGWNLAGLSRITRCRKTMAHDGASDRIRFDTSDRFCLDGQRLMVVSGAYGADGAEYRTENDVYARVVSLGVGDNGPATFKMYTKDGLILTLGGSGSATHQQPIPEGGTRTFAWALSRVEDRSGNFLTVTYDIPAAAEEQLPVEIRYTGSSVAGAPPALASVSFAYEPRTDVVGSFAGGFSLQLRRRLKKIEAWGPTGLGQTRSLLRSYTLGYRYDGLPNEPNGSAAGISTLGEVTECDGSNICRNPFRFTYAQSLDPTSWGNLWNYALTTEPPNPSAYADLQSFLGADVNADGRDDLVYRKRVGTSAVQWFVRYSNGTGFDAEKPLAFLPVPPSAGESTSDGRFTDWDGDGLLDFIVSTNNVPTGERILHLMKSWGGGAFSREEQQAELGTSLRNFWTVDLNGDGRLDLLRPTGLPMGGQGLVGLGYRLGPINSGAPFSMGLAPPSFPALTTAFPLDLDGSGRTGLLIPRWESDPGDDAIPYMVGSNYWFLGMKADGTSLWKETSIPREETSGQRHLFVDVNRDGLTDLVSYPQAGGDATLSLNTGLGFVPQPTQGFPAEAKVGPALEYLNPPPEGWGNTRHSIDNGVRVADINGDGLQDIVLLDQGVATVPGSFARSRARVLLSRGSSFVDTTLFIPIGAVSADRGMYRSLALDVNGDGQMDFVQPDSSASALQIWIRQGVKPFLLRSATDAMGARVEFDYAPLTDTATYTRGQSCIYPQPCVRQGMWLASEMRTEAGPGHPMRRVSYQYEDARLDAMGKGLLGIRKRTVTDHSSGSVSRETYALAPLVGTRYPLARQLLNRTVRTPLSNGRTWIRETVATPAYVERTAADGTRYFAVYTASKAEHAYELGLPTLWSVTHTVEDFDADFGNVKAEKWVWSDGYVSRRDTTYENRASTWQVGLPSRVTETATTALGVSRARSRSFTHAPGSGLLTDEVIEPDSTDLDVYLAAHYDYSPDGMGLRSGVTLRTLTGETRTTSYEYDAATKTTVSAIINPAGHRQMMAYHPGLGVLAATVDANGVRQRRQYDAFGRLRVEDGPTLADVSYEYLPGSIRTTRAGGSAETVFLDSLGRVVTRQRQDFAGSPTEENYLYNAAGRLVEVQRPSPSGGTAVASTRYQYDELGRLTRLTQPDDSFRLLTYEGLTLTETDARGNATKTELNGRGWAVKVSEPNPVGGVLNTIFEYGPFGTVTGTESVGRHASMEYDVRGRRTRLADPSNGVSVTRYNAFGDTRFMEDAEEEQQVFLRDALGRTTKVVTPLGESTYSWDTAVNGVGALAGTTSADGVSTAYAYDTLGRRSQETTLVEGAPYAFDYTYDAYGRLKMVAYPEVRGVSRLQLQYGYTPRGDLLDVRNVASQLVYWQVGARTASGHLSHAVLGNGTESHYGYDSVGSLRLVETGLGTSNLQRLLFSYDANGNLTERNDGVAESTEEFDYDSLDRLTRWTVYQNCQRAIFEYGFSPDGNLTSRTTVEGGSPSESYVYGQNGAPPHAVTQGPPGSYGYDARGFRVTAPGSTSVEYTVAGLPHRIQRGAEELTFQYDAFDARVRKARSNGESSVMVGAGLYEKQVERWRTRHLFSITAGGRPVARVTLTRRESGPFVQDIAYVHRDPLGSVEALSDQQGALVARMKFDPFGRRVFPQALATANLPVLGKGLPEGFTGHSHDDELGLINMKGRVYDPSVGRFLTPDPFVQSPFRSQSHNRYAYAWNNPLRYTDPSGLMNDGGCVGTPDDGGCWENVAVGGDGGGQSSDPNVYGPYFGWQNDTWYATGPDGRRRGPGRVPGSVTAGELEAMTSEARRAFFQAESTGGQVPANFGTDELDAAVDQVDDQFLLGMAKIVERLGQVAGRGDSGDDATQATAAVIAVKVGGDGGRGANNLKPDLRAEGPHTTFKKDSQGRVTGYAEWQPNPRNPTGFDQAKRVDTQHANPHTHNNVPTPHVHEKSAPGGVRPPRPDELPR
ncbi:VCBS repeat-containing protein [Corallococcus exiguus]|uniref:FG-GAP-like repeat-containing protein n=1 Tax=Corallococcus TaxID=83461 RepID=UPI000EA22552|nr:MULTISPECIES: FG-GAP-like repeat-containing protein [Corallococcus]NNC19209.1 hypothetical protein [Corallococcus exiguus]NRD57662.1 VCBS repeat-containing protein [Corallococcus exiguus]NRD63519.1 VCBS repeat-containing protein [Corallococcus exiguus]RKH19022.1 hypothetical protein D7V77_33215 [Corallococcus sp. CA041A]RKI13200.1 hypothetical protein D7Y15_17070 [Corallococcus sp. AB030]